MSTTQIQLTTLQFLERIKVNNNREWFNEHKSDYKAAFDNVQDFANGLMDEMNKIDHIEKNKVFRIYRDVRFSKDKTPYKTSLGVSMSRATQLLRGGYYFHIEPDNSFMAAGFWKPNSADLSRIRQEIAANPDELRTILAEKNFKDYFGELTGDKVKTAPKGYSKTDEAIDLLRYKQFLVKHSFTDKQLLSADFVHDLVGAYQAIRPFFNYMSEVLTTDANGAPLV
jgi:uncharacterized protein (TIGR02453 family)